jgi:chromosome segregation ATPase
MRRELPDNLEDLEKHRNFLRRTLEHEKRLTWLERREWRAELKETRAKIEKLTADNIAPDIPAK